MDWHALDVKEVCKKLKTSSNGLKFDEVQRRQKQYGLNEIKHEKRITVLEIFINQFKDFLILILLAAVLISALLGLEKDAIIIGLILILNAILGTVQEFRAEKAIEALKRLAAPKAIVIRDGKKMRILSKELVPGDIILLDTGDRVPADARLIEAMNMKTDESHLTGESIPEEKNIKTIKKDVVLADRTNMVFSGTIITYGVGRAVVADTGMSTQIGKIASMIQETKEPLTPLQKKMKQLGKQLGVVILLITALVFFLGIWRNIPTFEMFMTVVSLAVSAIPSGLPAVITITLAIGMRAMAKHNALVRKLPALETLGATTVICADKTGTLTKNQMTVKRLYVSKTIIDVTGEGYNPKGNFFIEKKQIDPKKSKDLSFLLRIGALCNNAHFNVEKKEILGDPTEGCLIVAAEKAGFKHDQLKQTYPYISELPFDSDRKRMSTINKHGESLFVYTKGAVESVLKKCSHIYENGRVRRITNKDREKILNTNKEFAKKALRVLSMAFKELPRYVKEYSINRIENNLVFVGLEGMIDPPRSESKAAIKTCEDAGIRVVMITGDYALTAKAIAQELGLIKKDSEIVTGVELDKMSDLELQSKIEKVAVFARVSPKHKVRIVKALKKKGHIVAMTGDGVNDAPSLKNADIGIAMGITGTDVAKEASDMILTDDNFATIVNAVKKGREIFDNIKKFIRYLLSANFDEIAVVSAATVVGFPIPFIAVQILWLNLITDGLPALALSVDPGEEDIMKRKPRDPKKSILKEALPFIIAAGLIAFAGTIIVFGWEFFLESGNLNKARTMAFTTSVMFELFLVFNARSDTHFFFEKGSNLFKNKYLILAVLISILLQLAVIYTPILQPWFETVPLTLQDWAQILPFAALGFIISPKFFVKKGTTKV